jgi:MOSC domain-containing protein YiiM
VSAHVVAVHAERSHRFSKSARLSIELLVGLGVAGDAHAGTTVRHRSRVARDPTAPNLRQVHLLTAELLDELGGRGFAVSPGALGENVTTAGIDLLALGVGTRLRLGADAEVELTGLRNPCLQLDRFAPGLQAAVLERDAAGALVRRAGVMAVVVAGGTVQAGDPIAVAPPAVHRPLRPV